MQSDLWKRPVLFWLTSAALLLGCRDAGLEKYREARARYEALVEQRRPPADPAYDEVLRLLDEVPANSNVREKADALRESLLHSRRPIAPLPLATRRESTEGEDAREAALRAECARLAEQLGKTPQDARAAVEKQLAGCRAALGKLEEERHHQAQP